MEPPTTTTVYRLHKFHEDTLLWSCTKESLSKDSFAGFLSIISRINYSITLWVDRVIIGNAQQSDRSTIINLLNDSGIDYWIEDSRGAAESIDAFEKFKYDLDPEDTVGREPLHRKMFMLHVFKNRYPIY